VLLGERMAIVPIGISCQAAFQIKLQQSLLESLAGEPMVLSATPFDWRIVGLGQIAEMIEKWELSPTSACEIELLDITGEMGKNIHAQVPAGLDTRNSRPYWRRQRCWFWHERFVDFDSFRSKQAHLAARFARLGQASTRLFFASNVQSNLINMQRRAGGFDIEIEMKDVTRLARALNERFGPSTLHIVTRPKLTTGFEEVWKDTRPVQFCSRFGEPAISVYFFPEQNHHVTWHGDSNCWSRVFENALRTAVEHTP
jgi:hypothetical protein